MERHLDACPRCKGACDSLKRTLSLCHAALPAAPVPAAVQASVKVALRNFLASNA
jgi:RNA polymerase sigma-70 factor (ECF subfamily)